MVFCNRNSTVHFLEQHLRENPDFEGVFETLSKQVEEEKRLEVLNRFHRGYTSLLLCSDLASRGIDTSTAANVINYEFPNTVR